MHIPCHSPIASNDLLHIYDSVRVGTREYGRDKGVVAWARLSTPRARLSTLTALNSPPLHPSPASLHQNRITPKGLFDTLKDMAGEGHRQGGEGLRAKRPASDTPSLLPCCPPFPSLLQTSLPMPRW
jgi:hypothetical protein